MYDIFFLSYNEPDAEVTWQYIKTHWPWARRVIGVSGIANAHRECAKRSLTSHFFVIDADNFPDLDFPFNLKLPEYDKDYVHVWFARNKPCGISYGWGGVKLFPKNQVLAFSDTQYTDFTMTFKMKIIEEEKSTNVFNTTAYDSWRAAFRECAKLAYGINPSDSSRLSKLSHWTNPDQEAAYAKQIKDGAKMGMEFAALGDLTKINDWEWLQSKYDDYAKSNS